MLHSKNDRSLLTQRQASPPAGARRPTNRLEGCSVQVDGWNGEHQVVCEAFARFGDLKAGQKRKLSTDILKLVLLQQAGVGVRRKILVVAGEKTVAWLCGGCWQARAVHAFGIEVFHVPLERAVAAEVLKSQAQQVMINVQSPDL